MSPLGVVGIYGHVDKKNKCELQSPTCEISNVLNENPIKCRGTWLKAHTL